MSEPGEMMITVRTALKRDLSRDFLQMTVFYLLSVYFVYFSVSIQRDIFFLVLLLLFWHSKKDYFWFGYFFILVSGTGHLFGGMELDAVHRLPIFNLSSGTSFSIVDLFVITAFIKALLKGNKRKLVTKEPLLILLLYFIFITIPVTFLLGTYKLFSQVRGFSYYSLMLSYFWLVNDDDEIIKFGYLLVPYLFLNIYDQLLLLFVNNPLLLMIDPSSTLGRLYVGNAIGEVRPVMGGVLLVFYCLIFGFQLYKNPKCEIFRGFAYVLFFASVFSFLLSVTRAWYSIVVVVLLSFAYFHDTSKLKGLKRLIFFCLLIVLAVGVLAFFENDLVAFIQLRTVEVVQAIDTGQFSYAPTLAFRIDKELPKVLAAFSESPILGVGLSRYLAETYNNDLGFVNTLMIYGVLGSLIFIFLFLRLFRCLNGFIQDRVNDVAKRNLLISLKVCLIGMLFGSAFTWDFFNPVAPFVIFFTSLYIANVNLVTSNVLKEDAASTTIQIT